MMWNDDSTLLDSIYLEYVEYMLETEPTVEQMLELTAAFMLLRHAIHNVFHLSHAVDLQEQSVCHKRIQNDTSKQRYQNPIILTIDY